MANPKPLLIPLILFFLSFILRLSLISKGPYHLDCLELALRSQATLQTFQIHSLFGTGYPFAIILGAIFQFFAKLLNIHDPVIAVNFMSVVFSSLCVLLNYYIARKLFDSLTALISSILLSLTPIFLGVSTYGISHAPTLFLFLSSVLWILSYHETQKRSYLLGAAIMFGLLGATRAQDMVLLMISMSYLFFAGVKRYPSDSKPWTQKLPLFGLAFLITLLTTLIFYVPLFLTARQSGYYNQLSFFVQIGLLENFRGIFSQSLWASVNDFETSLTVLGIFTVILGFLYAFKDSPRTAAFLFLWFLFPVGFYGNLFTTVSRFFVIVMPAILIPQAYFLSNLIKKSLLSRGIAMATLLVILLVPSYYFLPVAIFRHENALLVDYARWVKTVTEPNARIISIDINPFIEYYSGRKTLNRPAYFFKVPNEELQSFQRQLDELFKNQTPVYITASGLYNYDPGQKFFQLMIHHYNLEYLGGKKVEEWYTGCIHHTVNFYWLLKVTPKNAPQVENYFYRGNGQEIVTPLSQ